MTNHEIEYLAYRALREPIKLARIESGGARQGQTLQFDGKHWYPGVTIDNADTVILDLDGIEIVDIDGDGIIEPGDLVALTTEIAQLLFEQSSPSDFWTIPHGQQRRPFTIEVRDSDHNPAFPTVKHLDLNTTAIRFAFPTTGSAVLTFYLKSVT